MRPHGPLRQPERPRDLADALAVAVEAQQGVALDRTQARELVLDPLAPLEVLARGRRAAPACARGGRASRGTAGTRSCRATRTTTRPRRTPLGSGTRAATLPARGRRRRADPR